MRICSFFILIYIHTHLYIYIYTNTFILQRAVLIVQVSASLFAALLIYCKIGVRKKKRANL